MSTASAVGSVLVSRSGCGESASLHFLKVASSAHMRTPSRRLPRLRAGFATASLTRIRWVFLFSLLWLLIAGPADAQLVNLALNRPITALTDTVAGVPEDVVDGDPATTWWSYQGTVSTLSFVVDLGRIEPFIAVVQHPLQSSEFSVDISSDGTSWRQIHQQVLSFAANVEVTFLRLERPRARFFRYTASNAETAYVGIVEFQVYDTDRIFVDGFEGIPPRQTSHQARLW